ncbi:MAG: hypothetical protein PHO91_03460 [Patescibacteria group bacterium]|nr:hypothetical protein [Patescibacteria group bacterium]
MAPIGSRKTSSDARHYADGLFYIKIWDLIFPAAYGRLTDEDKILSKV